MTAITIGRDIAAPADVVWVLMTDIDGWAETVGGIKAVERTDGGNGFGVGTAWKETREMFGRESTEPMAVTAIEEGRSYTVESDSRGTHYRSVMRVEPTADGCHLSLDFGAEAQSLSARLMGVVGRLFEGSVKKAMLADLDDIAAAAEARTGSPADASD